ncbi:MULTISPECIES: LacI family DNA-binding transcriptional regulator [Cohnella]|uniref:LacI family DNA-binding transcriptional regulator n=1 Tax=Cohnella TaxID=329857 RepID=UPI0009B9FB59|nr:MULTISPECIES: LacI family DNA-binding transcriptional regulator [Cohnella]MBN2984400.1 LacI family DNA-binding transcriptional regulator [Cohnella algarum]
MVGLKEIAKMAEVSISTVSNVLNGRKNVGKETREKVLRICAEYGYSPAAEAKKGRAGASRTIVFIYSDFDRDFYLKIIQGLSDCLTENGYDFIICTHSSSESFLRPSFASGAIILDGSMTDEALVSAAGPGMPVVMMDRILESDRVNAKSVIVDNYPIMCEMVQALVDKGYRKFGFIGGHSFTLDNKERFAALVETLAKNGIAFDQKHYYHGNYRENSGYQAAKLMLLSNDLPEMLVCASDNMALGAIRAFEENGVRVPEDVAVTGFDDSETAAVAGLTTISIPRYESGYLAAKKLLEMIQGTESTMPFKIGAGIKWRKTTR